MIIIDRPPNFDQIKAAFPNASNPGVLFAYDGCIYNPSGITVPPALIAHENVHLKRQNAPRTAMTPDNWWTLYIHDSEFRYQEELLAHVAEMREIYQVPGDRNAQARILMSTALRLIAPLYNYQPPRTLQEAMKDLRQEIGK